MKKKILLFSLIWFPFISLAQLEDAWVYLTDKEDVPNKLANPITILTQKAIDRKTRHGVAIDARDVPVNEAYISQLKNAIGITVFSKSKWFNAVHVRGTQTDINNLLGAYAFVDYVEFADRSLNSKRPITKQDKFTVDEETVIFNYGNTQNQVEMIGADDLHVLDYTGEGVTIAVMDSGFPYVNTMVSLQRLRDNGDLLGGYDFVDGTTDVYAFSDSQHGTLVLSTMAGYIEDQFVGTAPDASYYLFRTEALYENPVEESYWVEATERADSLGVDLINTSLGYKDYFDDSSYDYSTLEMDGLTAFITKGANIAFEKGLILINSAGNSGSNGVNAPADSAYVLSIGAVDSSGMYASFSSQGSNIQPSQKPDIVAQGQRSYVIGFNNFNQEVIGRSDGTSFSSPIMAGGIACLMQALPNKTNAEIYQLVRESASQYMSPDNLLGYGIPDLNLALTLNLEDFSKDNFRIYPNPAHDNLFLSFPKNLDQSRLKVYDVLGKLLINKKVNRISNKINLKSLNRGIYVIKINAENVSQSFKLIKR